MINRMVVQMPPFFLKTELSQCPISTKQQNKDMKPKFRRLEEILVNQHCISEFFHWKYSADFFSFVTMTKN